MKFAMLFYQLSQTIIHKPPGLPSSSADGSTIGNILNLVLNIIGALALLIVTIGGFKYIISRGEPQGVAKAKETILYALIGLVVAILGKALVAFVFSKVAP